MTRAERLFELFEAELNGVDGVVEVRGRGGLIGIQLDRPAKPVGAGLRARGILVGSAAEPHTLRLMPPLVTPPSSAAHLAEALCAVLAAKR
jgi:acetylornithine/succinyldiaminopimelate/putrescine aminotransferase